MLEEEMISKHYWTTKSGDHLLVRDMETSHIQNCMKLIEKNNFVIIESFGSDWCDDICYDEECISLRGVYETMVLELRLRKLEQVK